MATPTPPAAPRRPFVHEDPFGGGRSDPFHWLKDREDPAVIEYLEAENEYTEAVLQSEQHEKALYEEFLTRIQETDETPPYRKGDYMYYTRTVTGLQYTIYCRRRRLPDGEEGEEEVVLDVNELADGFEYCNLGDMAVSHTGMLLAFAVDYDGDEKHVLRVKDLSSGELLPDLISDVSYGLEWSQDDTTLFYLTMDHAMRPYRLHSHVLGQETSADRMVLEEEDERFFLSLDSTMDGRFILVCVDSQITSEVHFLPATAPHSLPVCFTRREEGVEYEIECHRDQWYVLTSADECKNFKLLRCPIMAEHDPETVLAPAEVLIAHDRAVKLRSVTPFESKVVVAKREHGLVQISLMDPATLECSLVSFPEAAYELSLIHNREYSADVVRLFYSSFTTPPSTFDCTLADGRLHLVKERAVLGGYDRSLYSVERIHATADDGTRVPISLVRRHDSPMDGSAPLVLWGYGAYGCPYDGDFSSVRFSLVDRGVTCAVAHVRGGGDLGRYWYEAGKLLNKKNSFTDFIACAKKLAEDKYSNPKRMAVYGASAGGLLVGAVMNMVGDTYFSTVVARVPFVDTLSTMLDTSLPLTVIEQEEWGHPEEQEYFEYILSYSPYDNVSDEQQYPHLLLKGGLNDPRVSYWEPAKLCARLRLHPRAPLRTLVLHTNMGAGHFGASGRYEELKEDALEFFFLLKHLGVPPPVPPPDTDTAAAPTSPSSSPPS